METKNIHFFSFLIEKGYNANFMKKTNSMSKDDNNLGKSCFG